TVELPVVPPNDQDVPDASDSEDGSPRPSLRRGALIATVVLGLLALVYGIDLVSSRGEVPRGVTVAGVPVGGLERAAAEQRLREELEPRLTQPVPVRAGTAQTTLDPSTAGLALDWPATLDQAGDQPLNPWTRLMSLFTSREVGVATADDREQLVGALEALRPQTDRPPAEGTIRFEGTTPVPVDPVPGQNLDVPGATEAMLAGWASDRPVTLPVHVIPVSTTPEGIRIALTELAEPAVSAPVTITGDGANALLKPEVIATALRFAPDGNGGLTVTVDGPIVINALAPQLAGTEVRGRDAQIVFQGSTPTVIPSVDGHSIDWPKSLEPLLKVLTRTEDRTLPALYVDQPAKFTTEEANQIDAGQVISSFTTGGFAADSGQNIRRVAEQVNGTVVEPGETFSLNRTTGPRSAANGYIEAGIIEDGRPTRGIGGGVSQFATTLYNASYFAGMVDVEHKEHSYYISRYPVGREATVFEGAIDLKFRNDGRAPVLIQTMWTPSDITVRFLGSKQYDVESITGPRTNFTEPHRQTISGEPCTPSSGSPGFTVTDTRVLRDPATGAEVDRQTRRVTYEPQPIIVCE
ncbi:MAG: VanW family protein, partial [Actinomycetota bacterium]|nr:VanW family protein [Actinomycetota bacterium]